MNNIIPIGSCVSSHLLGQMIQEKTVFVPPALSRFNGRISAAYIPPGNIARRVREEMGETISSQPLSVRQVYNDIVKEVTPTSVKMYCSESTTILADFHYELFPFVNIGSELFLIRRRHLIDPKFPSWLVTIIRDHIRYTDSMSVQQNLDRFHLYRKFKQEFNNHKIIALGNCWATAVKYKEGVYQIFNKSETLFSNMCIDTTAPANGSPFDIVNRYFNTIKKFNPNWHWIELDRKDLYMAQPAHHQFDVTPVHLHSDSLMKLAQKTIGVINKTSPTFANSLVSVDQRTPLQLY